MQAFVTRRGNIILLATAAGTIIPANEALLGFQTNGTVAELLVSVGDNVEAGDVLAGLDDIALAEANLTVAEARYNAARSRTQPSQGPRAVGRADTE